MTDCTPKWGKLYPQVGKIVPTHDTHCTPKENSGVQSENPTKKIRKSQDFRPDFHSIGKIVPLFLLDNQDWHPKKREGVQRYVVEFSQLSNHYDLHGSDVGRRYKVRWQGYPGQDS